MIRKIVPLHPQSQVARSWDSRWYADGADYGRLLLEYLKIRKLVMKTMSHAAISRVVIERPAKRCRIIVYCARPAAFIADEYAGAIALHEQIGTLSSNAFTLELVEVVKAQLDARLVAGLVAGQIEQRIDPRRAIRRAVRVAMDAGAEGIRISVDVRADASRALNLRGGRVPLHTLRANIDYAEQAIEHDIGLGRVQVWIFKGEMLDRSAAAEGGGGTDVDPADDETGDFNFPVDRLRALYIGDVNRDAVQSPTDQQSVARPEPQNAMRGGDPVSISRLRRLYRGTKI